MPLLPIKIPPGVFRNGTPYAAKGRWYDSNLIRWHDNAARPIGGWERRHTGAGAPIEPIVDPVNTDVETTRDVITYRDNAGNMLSVFGTNHCLCGLDNSGLKTDLTPAGFTPGINKVTNRVGYGIGVYGAFSYGTPRNPEDSKPFPVSRWQFDMWGENVLAVFESEGILYEYTPGTVAFLPVANAPIDLKDVIVTDQRIVMGIRNTPVLRQVVWSDREDNTVWTDAVDNYAGSYPLGGTGELVGIYKVQNQVLILSETDAHIGTYLGAPFIYGFQRVGTNCEPLHNKAVSFTDRFAIWLGQRNFWIFDGTLRPLDCDVMDYLSRDLDRREVSKIFSMTISDFSEIWWFYQSLQGHEVDSYVSFNYKESVWAIGRLDRTAGMDQGAYNSPIMVDHEGVIWNHERQSIKVDGDAYLMTGPIEIEHGNKNIALRYVFPDTQLPNEVSFDFYTRQMPTDNLIHYGPFEYSNPVSTTGVLGREVYMKLTGLTSRWEVGTMRFDIQAVGGGFR